MSTSTLRLQLVKPLGSESMQLGASQLSDAYTKIDAAMGIKKFATQGAATGVFNGDMIVETSTGQSKLFNSPNWQNVYDTNNGKGDFKGLDVGPVNRFVDFFAEDPIASTVINVTAGRKYLGHYNIVLTTINGGGDPLANKGYIRLNFKYTTNIAITPNVLVHDVASWVSAINPSRSKNFKGMFEFFPNVTGQVKVGYTAEVLQGNQNLELNLNGATPNIYFIDWGV